MANKKIKQEDIVSLLKQDIDTAESYYESVILPKVTKRYAVYNADDKYYRELMPRLHEKTKIVSTDVADVIEWIMPKLMQVFFGSNDVVSIIGRNEEDVQKAQIMQQLINYQLTVINNGFMKFYRWFKDSLITGLGIIKVYWDRRYEDEIHEDYLGTDALEQLKAANGEDIELISAEPYEASPDLATEGGLWHVKYKLKKIVKNQPVIENIPITEFLYDPSAKTIDDASFIIHKKKVTADYLRKQADNGIYNKEAVERAIEKGIKSEDNDSFSTNYVTGNLENNYFVSNNYENDDPRKELILYECYEKLDINGDGKLEDVIVTIVGDEILRLEENTYKQPPFFVLSAILEPYKVFGKGYADIIGQLQDIKTALMKELIINLALSNESKLLVREDAIYVEDMLNNRPFIRIRQNVPNIHNVIYPMVPKPIHQLTMPMLEYIDYTRENRSGITRYSQGLDAKSLNKTATGIQQIMQASNQRLDLIIRIFAETGIKSLFRFLVNLNQKFIDEVQVIRLTNKSLEISPDDLSGDFDLIVNSSIATGTPDQQLNTLQLMVQHTMQVLLPLNLATPKNVYNLTKLMYEKLGYKNVDDFVTNPETAQAMQQQQQILQQQQPQQMPPSQLQQQPPPMEQQQQPNNQQELSPEQQQQLLEQMMAMANNNGGVL